MTSTTFTVKVSKKGQVVIPKKVRVLLGLTNDNSQLQVRVESNGKVSLASPLEALDNLTGILEKQPGRSSQQIKDDLRKEEIQKYAIKK